MSEGAEASSLSRALAAALLADVPTCSRLTAALDAVRSYLERVDAATLLRQAIDDDAARAQIAAHVAGVEHVGFLALPGETLAMLPEAARAAGFDRDHELLTSQILARELSALAGREVVTQLFIARGPERAGGRVMAEVFVPQAEPERVAAWIRDGVGTHVALRLHAASQIEEVAAIFRGSGYRVPSFMNDRPMSNTTQRMKALYLDREPPNWHLRIELL